MLLSSIGLHIVECKPGGSQQISPAGAWAFVRGMCSVWKSDMRLQATFFRFAVGLPSNKSTPLHLISIEPGGGKQNPFIGLSFESKALQGKCMLRKCPVPSIYVFC
jgi:hypothetical protein